MSSSIDEDAPALATVAAEAVGLLNDATGPEVGYPGLAGSDDVEDVLAALNRMAGDLRQTVAQLTRYLNDEVTTELSASGTTGRHGSTVAAARRALQEVQENTRTLAEALTTAETAISALRPSADRRG
ncbi:hypothetical protein [Actinoplanes sp. NPDC051494]|uniref:hypothetical protein n=1 Tax=Actinoplanes sp. NPDC051494 TaxID=3363907 RepID=UPI003794CE34